jgi:hypothetical protein
LCSGSAGHYPDFSNTEKEKTNGKEEGEEVLTGIYLVRAGLAVSILMVIWAARKIRRAIHDSLIATELEDRKKQ